MQVELAVHTRDSIGEVPTWCAATRSLWWADVGRSILHRFTPHDDLLRSWPIAQGLGSLALCRSGLLLLATRQGLFLFDPFSGGHEAFPTSMPLPPENHSFNGGTCDSAGHFWTGTLQNELKPEGRIYRIAPSGSVEAVMQGIIVPTGFCFAPLGSRLHVADGRRRRMEAISLGQDGTPSGPAVIFTDGAAHEGNPDGACIDAEGCLWIARYGGGQIVRHGASGSVEEIVMLPVSHPTNLCFGGDDLRTLFITTGQPSVLTPEQIALQPWAGGVLALRMDRPGILKPLFGN